MLRRFFNWLFNREPKPERPPVFRSYVTIDENRVNLTNLKRLTWDSEGYWATFTFTYNNGKVKYVIVNRTRRFKSVRDRLVEILRENLRCQYQSLPTIHFSAVEEFLTKHGSTITEISATHTTHELKVTMTNGRSVGYARLVASSDYDFNIIVDTVFSMGFVIAPYQGEFI